MHIPKPNLENFVEKHTLDLLAFGGDMNKLISIASVVSGNIGVAIGAACASQGIDIGLFEYEARSRRLDKTKWDKLTSNNQYYELRRKLFGFIYETVYNSRISQSWSSYMVPKH